MFLAIAQHTLQGPRSTVLHTMFKQSTHRFLLIPALILFMIILAGALIWQHNSQQARFDRQIQLAALQYNVKPSLIKAVIWQESRFKPSALGSVGEVGLMQIRELTAQEWCSDNKIKDFHPSHLFNPQTNIYIGTWYLGKMLNRYNKTDNPLPYALSDYNAGRKAVLRWTSGSALTNSSHFLNNITYPSTRRYVESVTQRSLHYDRKLQ